MTETETFDVPEVAKIPVQQKPEPKPGEPAGPDPFDDGGRSHSIKGDEKREAMIKAAVLYDQFEQQRQQLEVMLTEATLGIEARNRTIENLKLELAEARNNLCTLQSTCEALRQEVSDCRALFSSLRAQLDHFEIPLPVRRKVKNGKQIAA
jgi:chromosome segregation ATPase